MAFETILYEEDGPIGWLTLNRPDDGNMFTATMCHEIRDCINAIRRETRTRVLVITGAGERFFCLGGRKEGMEDTRLYAGVLPTLEIYESIDRLQKPVIASVNGFAVGGGNVLQVVCDLTIAKESAVFRQVGPMMGSFDAGYGTWYLEDLVGKKKAKELWYLNPKISARRRARDGPDQPGRAGRPAARRDPRLGARGRVPRRLRARLGQGRLPGPPRRRRRPRPRRPRPAAAPVPRQRGVARAERGLCRSAASPTRKSSATEAMGHLLTLHDPATARRHYEAGVWRADTFYTLLARPCRGAAATRSPPATAHAA